MDKNVRKILMMLPKYLYLILYMALYLQQFAVLALVLLSKSAQFVIENSPS